MHPVHVGNGSAEFSLNSWQLLCSYVSSSLNLNILSPIPSPLPRLPLRCAERTWSSRVWVFIYPTLNLSTVAEGTWWIGFATEMVSVLRLSEAAAAAPAVLETSATSTWTQPWWLPLRLHCRVAGEWWECWHSRVSQPHLARAPAVQAPLETRRNTAQETATTAAAQLHSAGVRALMLLAAEVGLTPALAPVWSPSQQGGGCKMWGLFLKCWYF